MHRGARWVAYWLVIAVSIGFAGYVVWDQHRENVQLRAQLGDDPLPAIIASPSQLAPSASPSASPSVSSSTARQRTALFIGDGYLLGGRSFGRLSCDRLAWKCRFDAGAGRGYLSGTTYATRLPALSGHRPDVVVVTGGRSDLGRDGVRTAARDYLDAVAEQFPKAKIVVVEPFWNDDVAYQMITDVRAEVKAATRQTGATWVVSENWLSGSGDFRSGGSLLSPTGTRDLASHLVTALPAALSDR